jgi:glycosyltransferase involved in cell wall biosynthesis
LTTGDRQAGSVLFVANDPPGRAVYRYRCENIAEVLRSQGHSVDIAWVGDRRVRVDHDIVVLHRICAIAEGREYARAARACGAVLVYGADDLVFDADAFPATDTSPATARLRRYAPLHAAMALEADAVLVSTEYLADEVRRVIGRDKPVFVVRNFLSPKLREISKASIDMDGRARKERVTLGYLSGTPTHDADLATIAEPLADILRANRMVELLLVGPVALPSALSALPEDHRRHHPFVAWQTLPNVLALIDINLAPLDLSRRLNHGKSEIKLLEAGAIHIPTIASASAGFREALAVDPQGGRLAETQDEWRHHLTQFIEYPGERQAAARNAHDYVSAHGTADAHREHIAEVFATIAALPHAAPRSAPRASSVGSPLAPKYLLKTALGRVRRSAS